MNEWTIIGIAYLLGSIPFGLLLSKIFLNIDIRKIGSGNIGATNVLRTGSKWIAFFTFALDIFKSALAVLLAQHFHADLLIVNLAGAMSIIGHMFPIWLQFRGGKGVASIVGALMVLDIKIILILGLIWLVMAKIFRISSLAAITGMLTFVLYLTFFSHTLNHELWIFITLVMLYRHKDNIVRLWQGRESRMNL